MSLIYSRHLKAAWGGTLGVPPQDIFSNGVRFFNFNDVEQPTIPQLQQASDAMLVPLRTWFTSPLATISGDAKLTYLKLNAIAVDGKQRDQFDTVISEQEALSGNANKGVPWYQTQAITLRAASSRGRAHAGRIFPPLTTAVPSGGGPYITTNEAAGMAQAFATCLIGMTDALNTTLEAAGYPNPSYAPGIISPGDTEKGTTERRSVYTRVVVDRVPDVQHRRTNQVLRAEGQTIALPFG